VIYSNPEYFILLLLTLVTFCLVPGYRFRLWLLIVSSFVFYSWAGFLDTLIFGAVIVIAWLSTWFAEKYPARQKPILGVGISLMAAHLLFWKYAPWITGEIQKIHPTFLHGESLRLPLPVGISFFTLQGIAYLVDLARRETRFVPFQEFVLFKSFFPQLVAGPIVRAPQLIPQLDRLRTPDLSDITAGATLFTQGLMKKLLMADWCGQYANRVFANPGNFDRWALIQGILAYSIQIWADFSGYTDMGVGSARMFGIRLPENFLSPYLARSPSDFWKRWHITLSQWIRDYIYIPLGGSQGGKARIFFVAIITMLISGLWHGANWTFVLWGLFHGLLLVAERLVKISGLSKAAGALPSFLLVPLQISLMFSLVALGWLLFRAPTIEVAGTYLAALWNNTGTAGSPPVRTIVWLQVLACFTYQALTYRNLSTNELVVLRHLRGTDFSKFLHPAAGVACGIGLGLTIMGTLFFRFGSQSHIFIYFQF
jgi:alginate O-acetyltransferase complex protein AlgI